MLDLSELLRTQNDEFVDLLQTWSAFGLLKTKFYHLEAIVEHEKLVKSVATVCDKKNAIANKLQAVGLFAEVSADACCKAVSDCKQYDCNLGLKCDQTELNCNPDSTVSNECKQDDSKFEIRDVTVDSKCEQDDRKPKTSCEIEYEQDDCKSEFTCSQNYTVGNECRQNDRKPEVHCDRDDTKDDNCKQDDNKMGALCPRFVNKPKTKSDLDPTIIFGGCPTGLPAPSDLW